ncbi:MAG: hypothetical protein CVU72_00880 [Deltaproteobacteria bacterium HGW-Deltaproteobacteria-7]|nr:MAG: hypothetical protein CVU72_00880 [Deltaproteobacteria bacterium HGW-Deltaproteobacteria-7]PKN20707.1 MAG: hypothetical protein CVU71_02680 [Deltaproteobacteria bacterium HGW-Deltaproteobacteria-6]
MNWPNKKDCENFEIKGFIDSYKKLKHGRHFIVINEREKPDRIVKDELTGEEFGIELTSEYLNERSVPDKHMSDKSEYILENQQNTDTYESRILDRIREKIEKAKKGYDLNYQLILSVYMNEYETIYMNEDYWRDFAKRYESFFDSIAPFIEIVLWPLPNDLVVSVRKNNKEMGA